MRQENYQDLSRYADDLAFAFPNILDLTRGLSDTDPVADVIAFHPIVLGFLNGFGRTMLRVASLKLQLEPESQALVHYRAQQLTNQLSPPACVTVIGPAAGEPSVTGHPQRAALVTVMVMVLMQEKQMPPFAR